MLKKPQVVEASWNVIAHTQKPEFIFRRNGRIHLNRRGRQFSRLLAAEVCASAVVMLDIPCSEVVWRVLATHSIPFHFASRASPCAITFQLDTPYESLQDVFRKRTFFFCGASSLPYLILLNFNVNRDYHDSQPVCIVLYLVFLWKDKGWFLLILEAVQWTPRFRNLFLWLPAEAECSKKLAQVDHFWFQLTWPPVRDTSRALLFWIHDVVSCAYLPCVTLHPFRILRTIFCFLPPFAPHFLSFLLSHILVCLHFKRDWIHQQTEVRNSYSVHGSRTHGLNLYHLITHHCSQTRKECWVTVCIASEMDCLTEPFNHRAYCTGVLISP